MLDAAARKLIDPPLNAAGARLARMGATADTVTLTGLALGLLACVAIWAGAFALAVALILLSRIADGLDGAVARASRRTDFGGYLDIAADFAFYGAVPLAFALHDPENALPAAFVLTSFYVNGTSFLGYAILAEKHRMETDAQGLKSLYFSNGLLEGTETIGFFLLICLFPTAFGPIAWIFGSLCFLTAILRVAAASRVFQDRKDT
ncbi:CDP-alcohol phosphatidyltransferase family protein [Histidinibacterium aquaticum]|uniref:CDP-alcohol phosphatidyltransferase family protein n=1 Tax=Histidinibacterium aquaticum TaxID=2613962 RepID=A0A5J5GFQ8_9RHOB|nr:CDP-alcohol phosphatidyltransferase family protein [Histidinibacterium aquaticum]KAA9007015.1 CDP-alcohol phosphatidyltransferase family protein [Histidinibacterium aquaticum]